MKTFLFALQLGLKSWQGLTGTHKHKHPGADGVVRERGERRVYTHTLAHTLAHTHTQRHRHSLAGEMAFLTPFVVAFCTECNICLQQC